MSTIGNDSSSTEAQNVREHYKEREKKIKAQNKAEKERISEAHKKEMQTAQKNYADRDRQVASSNRTQMDRQDLRHQKENAAEITHCLLRAGSCAIFLRLW